MKTRIRDPKTIPTFSLVLRSYLSRYVNNKTPKAFKFLLLYFFLITTLTLVAHFGIERYITLWPEILGEVWQLSTNKDGMASVENNNILRLYSKNQNKISIFQEIEKFDPGGLVRLEADIRCENVIPGPQKWHQARLLLIQNDGNNYRWDLPNALGSIYGTQDWKSYEKVFRIQKGTKKLFVSAKLNNCSGRFETRDIRLYPVTESPLYQSARIWIQFGWGLFGMLFIFSIIQSITHKRNILIFFLVLSFFSIVIGTSVPEALKSKLIRTATTYVQKIDQHAPAPLRTNLEKAGHFFLFLFFGLLIFAIHWGIGHIIFVYIVLLAGSTELSQFFSEGRTPMFLDFFKDIVGGLTGFLLVWLFFLIKEKLFGKSQRPVCR